MAVPVDPGRTWRAGVPKPVVTGDYLFGGASRTYDVSPDATRFLVIKSDEDGALPTTVGMIMVQNWFDELTRLAPSN